MKPLPLALVILLPVARLAGWLVDMVGQPAVLGELLAGMVLIILASSVFPNWSI